MGRLRSILTDAPRWRPMCGDARERIVICPCQRHPDAMAAPDEC